MNHFWASSLVVIFIASSLFGWFSMNGQNNEGTIERASRSVPESSSVPTNQPVDPEEYERFLESLYATQDARNRFFERVKPIFSELPDNGPAANSSNFSHQADLLSKPKISSATFRTYNYSTGEQFEDKFDCDLILLSSLESRLVDKVMRIENISGALQNEVLEICQSIDEEFTCLLRYAEKCEREMGRDTFNILQYIIRNNNETIMSCRAKENDWTGFGSDQMNEQDDDSDEWVDANGVRHFHNRRKYSNQTCISPSQVHRCFEDNFGLLDFDLARQAISTRAHCDALLRFERCIKHWIFEKVDPYAGICNLEEKETSIDILRGMFIFNLNEDSQLAQCISIRDLWGRSNYAAAQKKLRENDSAFKLTETLRSGYQMIKGVDCHARTVVDDELCLSRFEKRVRNLWHNQGIDNLISWEDEKHMMCCATAELSTCMATFVLVRCGVHQFGPFQDRIEFVRLASLPLECATLPYSSEQCHSILY